VNPSPRTTLVPLAATLSLGLLAHLSGCANTAEAPRPAGRSAAINSYVQGVLAYNSGDRDKAIVELQHATKQQPNLVMPHAMLGDLYQSKKAYNEALEQYQVTTQLDPYAYKNHYNEGLMYQLLNRVKEAIASYLRALQLNPQDVHTNQNLGVAYLKLDDVQNAIKYSRRAVELDPSNAGAWSNLAVALDSGKQYKEAEAAYRKALELDATHVEIAVALADNLMRQQRFPEARSVMDQVVQVEDTAPHRKRLGDTLFLEKKYDEALGEYARALKLDSRYFPALNETGWLLITQYNQSLGLEESKRHAALDAWRQSLLLNPNQPRVAQLVKTYSEKFSDENR
jgi:tetratricopeptide (TPR) repeat protein